MYDLDWREIVGYIAGVVPLLGFIPYIITTLKKKTQPNRASWMIWATFGIILVASSYAEGAQNTIWLLFSYAVCQSIIAILSIKRGVGGWSQFDQACIAGAGVSLIAWWWFKSPLLAILIIVAIDASGALPTIRKAYYEPETEDLFSWLMFWIAGTLNLIALEEWSVGLSAFPLYLFTFNSTITFLLIRPKIRQHILSKHQRSKAFWNQKLFKTTQK
ncbi:MAG: hypothetical protein AAF243_17275 [Cyanobacteria bacterium P01_A01_bin.137]